jgi:DNA-binding LytR/AlgR family response regulator
VLASDRTDQIAELKESLATLKKALGEKFQSAQEFWVKAKGQYLRIPPEQVIRFEADCDYVNMYLDGACYTYPEGMASIERRLGSVDFWRIHRSMIVRRTAIMRVKQASFGALILILSDGAEVRVGRTYLPKIRAALNRQTRS